VGDCLIYTNVAGRLNYTVGGEVITLQHLDRPLYIVGYLPKENRCAARQHPHPSPSPNPSPDPNPNPNPKPNPSPNPKPNPSPNPNRNPSRGQALPDRPRLLDRLLLPPARRARVPDRRPNPSPKPER